MGDFDIADIDSIPNEGDADPQTGDDGRSREEWVRANFTRIFGTSARDLRAQGIDPRRYAADHRDQIRRFARSQRQQGIAVPGGAPTSAPGNGWRSDSAGGARFGIAKRGGAAWIGILVALFALRLLLVGSFFGPHAAIYWVLIIGGILLAVRVLLFSWLRRRRFNRPRPGGDPDSRAGSR